MPTRKQRRRRDKTFRHDYETVLIDEDGNETPLTDLRTREEPKKNGKSSAAAQSSSGKGKARPARPVREVQPPSWNRALRKGGTWGAVMFFVSVFFLFRKASIELRVGWGLLYAVAFVPLTYYVDRTAYRTYERRRTAPPRPDKKK